MVLPALSVRTGIGIWKKYRLLLKRIISRSGHFALALSHKLDETHFYKIPTLPELRLQVFSDLAYGAQAIQYFTYRGLQHDDPTEVYDLVKTVNQEVQQLAGIFLGAQVISVSHTGSEIPEGTKALGSLPTPIKSLTTSDTGAVVSVLEKGGNQYLVVVNRDFRNVMNLSIDVDSSVSRVLKMVQRLLRTALR